MELLTVKEVARELRVTPITVRRYIAAGRLAAVRVGRGVRIERGAVERFVGWVNPLVTPEDEDQDELMLGEPTHADDPLWGIIGIFDSGPDGPTDVSSNKYKYLAEAYVDNHDR